MLYEARKFVKESYEQNDLLGKKLLVAYLHDKGHTIKPETFDEDFGVDILTELNGKEYKFEVEMKDRYHFTSELDFPFETVSFLGRKEKWKDENFEYCIIGKDTKAAIFCNSNVIYNKDYRQVIGIDTSHRYGNDMFYRVPLELCSFRTPQIFFKKNYEEIWDLVKNKLNL
jgi:hypothetical protein